jgi:hypothetical protein
MHVNCVAKPSSVHAPHGRLPSHDDLVLLQERQVGELGRLGCPFY